MDLAYDPLLDTVDELGCGDLSCAAVDKPGVGQSVDPGLLALPNPRSSRRLPRQIVSTYRPADIVGHVCSLQMGNPFTEFTSWMT